MDFPITRPCSEKYFSIDLFKKQIRTSFEDGTALSRAQSTAARSRYTVGWEFLPKSELKLLRTFFAEHVGGSFTWDDPFDGILKTVRFSSDSLPKAKTTGHIYNILKVDGEPDQMVLEMAFDTGSIELEDI